MYKILKHTAFTAILGTLAFAQAPPAQQPQTPSPSTTEQAAVGPQSYRGILMDASCKAIQNRTTTGPSASADVSRSRVASPAETDATLATPGVSTDQSGQATATKKRTDTEKTDTERAAASDRKTVPPAETRSTASSDSSLKTYDGNTGGPATKDATGVATSGERSRSADASTDAQMATVREKYKDCKVTPTTSSFALMSKGQLYMIDDADGALRQKMSTDTSTDWHTVTLKGDIEGDRIRLSSID